VSTKKKKKKNYTGSAGPALAVAPLLNHTSGPSLSRVYISPSTDSNCKPLQFAHLLLRWLSPPASLFTPAPNSTECSVLVRELFLRLRWCTCLRIRFPLLLATGYTFLVDSMPCCLDYHFLPLVYDADSSSVYSSNERNRRRSAS
jgi:hypothetical protein